MPNEEVRGGWGKPPDSPKEHFWLAPLTTSFCRRWFASPKTVLRPQDPAQRVRSAEQCPACWERLFPEPTAMQKRLLMQAVANQEGTVFVAARDSKAVAPMLTLRWFDPVDEHANLCVITEKGRQVLAVALERASG